MPPKKRQSRGIPAPPEDDTEARDEAKRKTSPPPPPVTVQPVSDKKPVTAMERRTLAGSVEAGIEVGPLQSGVTLKTGARCTWVELRKAFSKQWDAGLCSHQKGCRAGGLMDPVTGKPSHMVCRKCGYVCHASTKNSYYLHVRSPECREDSKGEMDSKGPPKSVSRVSRSGGDQDDPPMGTAKDVAKFMDEVVPVLMSKSPMGHKSAIEFITDYEYYRPIVNFRLTTAHIPQRHDAWNAREVKIADKMWSVIVAKVEDHMFFGLAVDGGVDEVRSRYILVMVVYVGGESFELPPVYEASGRSLSSSWRRTP